MGGIGRPSEYTEETGDRICALLAEGRSLRSVCKEEWAPAVETVFRWMRTYPQFQERYARAKQEAADALVEEMLDIADDASQDWTTNERGRTVVDSEAVQRSRLRVDTRKWIASKLKPKKYGEKLEVEVGATDDLAAAIVAARARAKPQESG